jgi:hypothetical protein
MRNEGQSYLTQKASMEKLTLLNFKSISKYCIKGNENVIRKMSCQACGHIIF